ncbi:heptaprenyl diphosphate synthase component II [Anaerobacillus sp. MEB173]|uniref:heptaprenyl diphosphate synthase component II n=1 Tax=Anaerobacillus sp. MEB173 TaxID=3383345 RepID=UPI003F8EF648
MKLTDIYWFLRSDIAKIEKELEATIQAKHPILKQASTHLLKAGGKRIRPVFVLLAAKFGNYDLEKIKKVAVPLELIHTASLVHDDVIDEADLRRGKKTIKAKWDNRVAMYTGDYIFAIALDMITLFDNPKAHRTLSSAIYEMTIGEIEQIRYQYNWDQNLRIYLRRIKRKTALLIAMSCELGALVSEASNRDQQLLYSFGYNVGMAFQITDDILDFTGTEKELGKPAGSDLRQGNVTLPALYAMKKDPSIKEMIAVTVKQDEAELINMNSIITRIKESGGIEYSKSLSDKYLDRALASLEQLPDIQAKSALYEIAQYIGRRKF